jgi:hypothetical protein
MCCLRYEHDFYVQSRKRFPKEGRIVRTARGEEKIIANDIFRERVTLRAIDGETRIVPLAELRRELAESADSGEPAESAGDPTAVPEQATGDETPAPAAATGLEDATEREAEGGDGPGRDRRSGRRRGRRGGRRSRGGPPNNTVTPADD